MSGLEWLILLEVIQCNLGTNDGGGQCTDSSSADIIPGAVRVSPSDKESLSKKANIKGDMHRTFSSESE